MKKVAVSRVQGGLKPHPQIKNIIAVASGKGGVGKSTTATNLAFALAAEGFSVGLLDADIYGPNQPHLLGNHKKPEVTEQEQFIPINCQGVATMSIGYLIDSTTPTIWRGPMVSQALMQLYRDTQWPPLDFLLIDLPPGTGDIQLTLAKKIPLAGAVIITTPQDIALLDARKGLEMFRKVNVNVLGIIENMSKFICPHCQKSSAIFNEGGGERIAQECEVPLLGQVPLTLELRDSLAANTPLVLQNPQGKVSKIYREIVVKMQQQLAKQPKDYSHKFPNIVVEPKSQEKNNGN